MALKPCDNCPFRKDYSFPLGKERRVKIAKSLLEKDQTFGCHKTTTFDDNDKHIYTDKERPCAGAVHLVTEVTGTPFSNLSFRLLAVMKDQNFAVGASEMLCATVDEFITNER